MFAAYIWNIEHVLLSSAQKRMETKRQCLWCGMPISGRLDKLFCSASCKNAWHNHITGRERRCRDRVNTILWNNYKILQSLMETGEKNVLLSSLPGFMPDYVTGYRKLHNGRTELFCFDIMYNKTEARLYNIRQASDLLY